MTDHADNKPLTCRLRPDGQAVGIADYERAGGYQGLRAALQQAPLEVQAAVVKARLRGRGGAGFYAGRKWSGVPMGKDAPRPKYVVANGDEMEPGTMKDRLLLEGDPHQLVEGMIVTAYAVQAEAGYVFLRREYVQAARRVRRAIDEALAAGYLGKNILGSEFSLSLRLHTSAGRYMCGEEEGMLNALEGKRAVPRSKPPHTVTCGLWGKPTVANNVETLCCVPHIVCNGPEWFLSLARTADGGGTKLYGASGRVKRPGLWELPLGTTLGEIFHDHAGGMAEGYAFRGLLPGGASTSFLLEKHFDVPMDFAAPDKKGSRLGTGTMIVLDDKTCPVGMLANMQAFFARESCGWCTPCREGLPCIESGAGQEGDLEILDDHVRMVRMHYTFCALAPGAMMPLEGALLYFHDDFERHIRERRCPWRTPC